MLWGLWFLAVPETWLADSLQRTLATRGIALELTGFEKGFFFTLHAERASLSPRLTPNGGSGGASVVVEDLDITPDFLSLLMLSPRVGFSGRVGQGRLQGTLGRTGGGVAAEVHGRKIELASLPLLTAWGISGGGELAFDFQGKDSAGKIVFSIENAKLSGAFAGNSAIPLNFFQRIKGLLTLGNTITVNSLTMEGRGIYLRMKGEIKGGRLDGRAEIMADTTFAQYPLLQAILERYKVSPGYYVIPFSNANVTAGSS